MTMMSPPIPSRQPRKIERFRARIFRQFEPPVSIRLSEWANANIVLPANKRARPGKYRTWPYFREIFDTIGSGDYERITLQKPTQVGFTSGTMIAIAAQAAVNPCAMGLVVPSDDHAKEYVTDELMPIVEASPLTRGMFVEGRLQGRNTTKRKRFKTGASLKVLSARALASLRRHSFKFLVIDEADAFEVTREGDPIKIVEKRTFAHGDRTIVLGSSPSNEDTSAVERSYLTSDQRIFEIACPHCDDWFELLWEHIQWPEGEPDKAVAYCPKCGSQIDERLKPALVENGRWRATRPEIRGHAGFRFNALVSLLDNAAWPKLAQDFLDAKHGGPSTMQVFINTILAKTWKTTLGTSAELLAARAEPIGLPDRIPEEIVLLTCGADVQNDRIELTILGWPVAGAPAVLAHAVVDGNTLEDETWRSVDEFLRTRYRHPNGWDLKVDATAIDSGDGKVTQKVYDFCGPRLARRVYAIKGVSGARPIWAPSKRIAPNKTAKLFIVGHDGVKAAVLNLLSQDPSKEGERPHALRVSEDLEESWFEQVTNEVRKLKYVNNRPVVTFQPKRSGLPIEAADCLGYAWAVRQSPAVKAIDLRARAARRPVPPEEAAKAKPGAKPSGWGAWAARFNQG